jgi:hypothetical protein
MGKLSASTRARGTVSSDPLDLRKLIHQNHKNKYSPSKRSSKSDPVKARLSPPHGSLQMINLLVEKKRSMRAYRLAIGR